MRRLEMESFDSVHGYDYELLNYIPEINALKFDSEVFFLMKQLQYSSKESPHELEDPLLSYMALCSSDTFFQVGVDQ
jgi:hypothetical protein